MQTENDTSKPEDSPEQEAGEGCSGATCSASFTPGPWYVRPRNGPGGITAEVCYGADDECITDGVYEMADAKLIAAVPKMLEALRFYATHMKLGYDITDSGQVAEEAIRAALSLPNAKAMASADKKTPSKEPTL